MARSKLVGLLFNTWDDADRAFDGLSDEEALQRYDGGSCFAWTLAHMTRGMDFMINVTLRKGRLNPVFAAQYERFGFGGDAEDWSAIAGAVEEVRAELRSYLEGMSDDELENTIVPAVMQWPASTLRYIIQRNVAHHYYHIGEVAAKRSRLGRDVGDYPGELADAM